MNKQDKADKQTHRQPKNRPIDSRKTGTQTTEIKTSRQKKIIYNITQESLFHNMATVNVKIEIKINREKERKSRERDVYCICELK